MAPQVVGSSPIARDPQESDSWGSLALWRVSCGLDVSGTFGVLLDVEAGDGLVHGLQDGRAVLGEQV